MKESLGNFQGIPSLVLCKDSSVALYSTNVIFTRINYTALISIATVLFPDFSLVLS